MPYPIPSKAQRSASYQQALKPAGGELPAADYATETRAKAKRFLLVCEGANTEPLYFRAFPVPTKAVEVVGKTVEVIGGFGGGKMYLVNETIKLSNLSKYKDYEVWCIFDYDVKHDTANQKQDFDNAILKAHQNGFNVAFSNDCFELWFVLHYKNISSQHHRTEYYDMLSGEWKERLGNRSYESAGKEVRFSEGLYKALLPYQAEAIKRAKQLHEECLAGSPYHQRNPCTTVYELVESLNENLASGFRK